MEAARYKRFHLLAGPAGVGEAARFLASALLVSHGVRRDSLAAVGLRGGWIVAAGDVVRHLRPDADTAEGWVRAVLRGRRGLGGYISSEPPSVPRGASFIVVEPGWVGVSGVLGGPPWVACYGEPLGACSGEGARLGVGSVPPWLAPAVVNVVLDRVEAGLKPC